MPLPTVRATRPASPDRGGAGRSRRRLPRPRRAAGLARAALAALAVALSACAPPGPVQVVSAEKAVDIIGDEHPTVLDVRTPAEFGQGHIPGALNIDIKSADFTRLVDRLPKDDPYLVICRSGTRSAQAAKIMAGLGFGSVYDVDGGVLAWADAGGALE